MTTWQILVVEDDPTVGEQVRAHISRLALPGVAEPPTVTLMASFDDALEFLRVHHVDALVLDVRDQNRADSMDQPDENGSDLTEADVGSDVFQQVRATRFVPTVFFTGLPRFVEHLATTDAPFVAVVDKNGPGEPFDELSARLHAVFESGFPAIHRALLHHVDAVVRDFMVEFVEQHWSSLSSPPRKGDVAHLLIRRLALSLGSGGRALQAQMEGVDEVDLDESDVVHPMRMYVTPPVGDPTTGDLLRGPRILPPVTGADSDPPVWYLVITPACDLVTGRRKADFLVLVECVDLASQPELTAWREATAAGEDTKEAKRTEKQLVALLRNNPEDKQRDRFIYLPAAWSIPDLLIDFQRIVHLPFDESGRYERMATLDSPYAESVVATLGRYLGRLGTPDLDLAVPLEALRGDGDGL